MSKFSSVVLAICLIAVATASFASFEKQYSKTYDTPAIRAAHMEQYNINAAMIRKHNADPSKTHFLKMNKFGDLNRQQMSQYKGYKKHVTMSTAQPMRADVVNLPVSIDWRTSGAVTAVKDQGGCGDCWAFSTVETIESSLFIGTGKLLTLSPQNLMTCTPNPDHCGGTGQCEGGVQELGFAWAEGGVALDSTMPYTGTDGPCDPSVAKAARVVDYTRLAVNDGNALMNALATQGPVAISVDAGTWQFYGGGVYSGCDASNPDIDHAVQAVGYGVDASSNTGFWLVRNSWGSGWGEAGYIRLYRGPNETCGMDAKPQDGNACMNQTAPVKVCGTCGIWFDNSIPTSVVLV